MKSYVEYLNIKSIGLDVVALQSFEKFDIWAHFARLILLYVHLIFSHRNFFVDSSD